MIGITPRALTMTPGLIEISKAIIAAVPDFPQSISDLISEMAQPDFSLAQQELELNKDGEAIPTQRNQQIIACIERALTAPSSECDPKIKATVFHNASVKHVDNNTMKRYLVQIVNGLKSKGQQIILDDIELDNFNFSMQGFDFSGMSARKAVFKSVGMKSVNLEAADFTGASFINASLVWSNLNNANITDATFFKSHFYETEAHGLIGNQSVIKKIVEARKYTPSIDGVLTATEFIILNDWVTDAIADSETFTLPAKLKGIAPLPLLNFSKP